VHTILKHFASPKFWESYNKLPISVRELADKNFNILKNNPKHPSLHFKQIGKFWSVRIGRRYRALAIEESEGLIWFWIGSHTDYEEFLK
jgi:hypothetical protein